MYELLFALKYLMPKKKALSTSLISIMSIFVISLVVWLVVVFLSVTTGIEKNWLTKLTSFNSPIQITPTKEYFSSYYYLIDSLCEKSNYSYKTIEEKALTSTIDPYNPDVDMMLPCNMPKPVLQNDNKLLDPVKKIYNILDSIKNVSYQDFEISGALMKLTMKRDNPISFSTFEDQTTTHISQMIYLTSYAENNPNLKSLLITPDEKEIEKLNNDKTSYKVFIPKSMQSSGLQIGDKGYLIFQAQAITSQQEQQLPIIVSGFYDSGVLPVGNRCIIVPKEVTRIINSTSTSSILDTTATNGINVWTDDIKQAENIKKQIQSLMQKEGISSFWKVSTYQEYEFSKDLMQQFQSDKTLFTLIAIIILIVACSNIISLLILLVNDKKHEIAVLRAMGSSSKNISLIFGGCGVIMGMLSSLIGIFAAIITLKNLNVLVSFLNTIQGHAAFNTAFFGDKLPNTLSYESLIFVLIATPIISLIAGIIPAIKASRINPSTILRAE